MLLSARIQMLPPLIISLIFSSVNADSFLSGREGTKGRIQDVLEHPTVKQPATCTKIRLTGPIETTLCDYETVESVNEDLYSQLDTLVRTPFFKYFKVDLYRDCPFWQDNGFCMHRECGVTSVDESQVPEQWRAAALSQVRSKTDGHITQPGCYHRDADFCFLDDEEEGEFVDLTENPEGFTGYAGPSAHRVWNSIYEENCFGVSEASIAAIARSRYDQSPTTALQLEAQSSDDCVEKRVYYKIISGLHASISTHICHLDLNRTTGQWGPNLQCFASRVASHPERLKYIYFNTVLLLRAVSQETKTNSLLKGVLDIANDAGAFDETALFRGDDAKVLKEEFKNHFRNVSRIMDCVGCDKCRLWGKVQVTGLAAALKILFEMDEKALDPRLNQNLLTRSEVVALLNTLHRFSESLHVTEEFKRMWSESHDTAAIVAAVESPTSSTIRPPSPRSRQSTSRMGTPNIRCLPANTIGCFDVLMRQLSSFLQRVLHALRRVAALSGKDQGPGRGEF
ncbi:hypothetical protein BS47DRAFT_1377414 [Hydnum rufescens UP504]|uniref:Endoplasmic oxidoreductin n=1 Tax=Hydnum rufescens UP504 TaxID=1448309 RepID=A0A9P6ARP1_9AGAM|nr:hypothetical protein BS47DRAFT_1377414 [Hydnum rufescens UP504]